MTSDHTGLLAAARGGDRDAVEHLFAAHWRDAWRTARTLCGDDQRAQDVAQDAMLKALGGLDGFDGRRPFAVWLRRIVVNEALNARRRDRRLVDLDAHLPSTETAGGVEPGLRAAVRGLPAERRVVVMLRYGLDLTPAEIADALDIPVGTVNSRLGRALADLRRTLEVTDVR